MPSLGLPALLHAHKCQRVPCPARARLYPWARDWCSLGATPPVWTPTHSPPLPNLSPHHFGDKVVRASGNEAASESLTASTGSAVTSPTEVLCLQGPCASLPEPQGRPEPCTHFSSVPHSSVFKTTGRYCRPASRPHPSTLTSPSAGRMCGSRDSQSLLVGTQMAQPLWVTV